MRRSKADTAKTRRHIVETAAQQFRKHGIDSISLADIMAEAGLTHGGFYRHFESKDQLVEEACASSLTQLVEMLGQIAAEKDAPLGLKAIGSLYLSTKHRDDVEDGCPLAALGDELARSEPGTRKAMTEGVKQLVEIIAAQVSPQRPEAAKRRALAALSMMVGALTLSRIVTDSELSVSILTQAKKQFVELLRA
jgi:TetR/AcrR family transcriptional repressor of nem operon